MARVSSSTATGRPPRAALGGCRGQAVEGSLLDERQTRGESVTAIAAHLSIGRSTLYRALANPAD